MDNTLQEKINALYIRMVCVTDDILREQLAVEYSVLVEEQELENERLLKEKRLTEKRAKYSICSLQDLLIKSNIDVNEIYKTYRLRPLTTLSDRRTLVPFLQAFNAKLIVKDIDDNIIDTINNGEIEYTLYTIDSQPCYKL